MQERVHQRAAPLLAHDVGADDDVPELARHAVGQRAEPVDRKGERVRCLIDAEVPALQRATLVGADEGEPELSGSHALAREDRARKLDGRRLVHLGTRAVVDLDLDHRLRWVPVCSACALYASTIRCTSLWRTTSWWLNSTKAMPSTVERMSRTWISPDACSRGRSTWVTSPVTSLFERMPRVV